MTESMIERVARAQWERRRKHAAEGGWGLLEEWGDGSTPKANGIIEEARAAIEAMREPSAEDIKATGDDDGDGDGDGKVHWNYRCHVCGGLTEGWHKIIDAALSK